MSDQQSENRRRNLKIADNEAARQQASAVRLSSWAVGVVIVVALVILAVFLKR